MVVIITNGTQRGAKSSMKNKSKIAKVEKVVSVVKLTLLVDADNVWEGKNDDGY